MQKKKKESKFIFRLGSVFLLFFVLVFLLGMVNPNYILGSDPYFHIKRAELLREGASAWDFPYLPFVSRSAHFWKSPFFHFLLIPFAFGDLLLGAKLALATLNAAIFVLFYYILKKNNIRQSLFWCLFLFFVSPLFLFRLQLLRPYLISIFLILLGVHFLVFKRSRLGLFWVAFFLVIFYRFPFALPVIILGYLIACLIARLKIDWWVLGSTILGTITGFLIMPGFSERLSQTYLTFKILYLIYFRDLNLKFGGELYPLGLNVFWSFILIFAIFAILLPLLWFERKNLKVDDQKERVFTLLLSTGLFGILVFKSQRFAEYFVPLSVLTISYLWGYLLRDLPKKIQLSKFFQEKLFRVVIVILVVTIVLSSSFLTIFALRQDQEKQMLISAGYWLEDNTLEGEIIFHNNWGDFTELFFTNSKGRYILGADPISLYNSDPELYYFWYNISNCGLATTHSYICDALIKDKQDRDHFLALSKSRDVYDVVRGKFHSRYIFLSDWQNSLLDQKLREDRDLFLERYENEYVRIYELR